MKKYFILLAILFAATSFAQKTVYIFNNSSYSIQVGEYGTKYTGTGTYPFFTSWTPSLITVAAGASYVLENTSSTTKFPFTSVGNTPQITQWKKQTSSTTSSIVGSASAYASGATQNLDHIKFQVGTNGTLGGNTFFITGTYHTYTDALHGWYADFDGTGSDETVMNVYNYP